MAYVNNYTNQYIESILFFNILFILANKYNANFDDFNFNTGQIQFNFENKNVENLFYSELCTIYELI